MQVAVEIDQRGNGTNLSVHDAGDPLAAMPERVESVPPVKLRLTGPGSIVMSACLREYV